MSGQDLSQFSMLDLFRVEAETQAQVLAILNSRDRIPFVRKMGEFYYNLWQDAANPRGLWRRIRKCCCWMNRLPE